MVLNDLCTRYRDTTYSRGGAGNHGDQLHVGGAVDLGKSRSCTRCRAAFGQRRMNGVFPYRLLLLDAGKIKPSVTSISVNLRLENTTS